MYRLLIVCLAFELISISYALDLVVIDGFWSPWSARASPCYMSPTDQTTIVLCGVGFSRKYRSCTDPKPQGGGRNCSGASEQWLPCNTHACQLPDGEALLSLIFHFLSYIISQFIFVDVRKGFTVKCEYEFTNAEIWLKN
jgi:hypothetical protein